jgi:glucose-1-phosphate thymidylyltransferase
VPGLHFCDNRVVDIAAGLKPFARGELEIVDAINTYLSCGELKVKLLGRGFAWLDMGAHESLLEASNDLETIEKRQGLKIACVEEVAFRMGCINPPRITKLAESKVKFGIGIYLLRFAKKI